MKLKEAIEMIIAAVEQEQMETRFSLVLPIKRLELEVELIDARENILDMERPLEWDGRRKG